MAAVAIVITAATLLGMLARPWGRSEAFFAGIGGAAMLATTAVSPSAAWREVDRSADVLLFLLGMMIVTAVVETSGVFDYLAEGCARLARGSGPLLLANIFVLGAVVTALLSLDAMIIVMTPVIYALTVRRRLDPIPYLFACAFVANTGSLLLPISNLTNLLAFSDLGLSFGAFAERMWLPAVCAVVANYIVFRWLFRERVPARFDRRSEFALPPASGWFWFCAGVLAVTLVGLIALGLARRPLSLAALLGAGLLLIGVVLTRKLTVKVLLDGATPSLFVFVIGLLIVVRGVEPIVVGRVAGRAPSDPRWALLAAGVGAAVGSNIVNNVPVTLLVLSVARETAGAIRAALTYGALAGANIGPTLTTYGSLATMLWLTILRRRGLAIRSAAYMRVSVVTMPVVLLAALTALWLTT
jgi:arsenical pump membrane protein